MQQTLGAPIVPRLILEKLAPMHNMYYFHTMKFIVTNYNFSLAGYEVDSQAKRTGKTMILLFDLIVIAELNTHNHMHFVVGLIKVFGYFLMHNNNF